MENKESDLLNSMLNSDIANNIYNDLCSPSLKVTGNVLSLVPRAINIALSPIEIWISKKESNIAAIKERIGKKLSNIPVEDIVSPENYIAIPALEAASYCIDNEDLINIYANLLSSSMNAKVKNGVHPSFVDIIKQMCPDEAKLLANISKKNIVFPIITLQYVYFADGGGVDVLKNFSSLGEESGCENSENIYIYLENLSRLGFISLLKDEPFAQKELYSKLENHKIIKSLSVIPDQIKKEQGYTSVRIIAGRGEITEYGKAFCNICVQ